MTREELRKAIVARMATCLSESTIGATADEVLDLFDRFEEEQWSKPGEVPSGKARHLVIDNRGRVSPYRWKSGAFWVEHWRFRELPAPPKEVPNG